MKIVRKLKEKGADLGKIMKKITMGKKEKKIDENEGNTPKINNKINKLTIYSKNSIQFRNDNIVNLINLNGKLLDKNTEILIKNKIIKPKLPFTENIIEIINIDNKNYSYCT